MELEFIVKFCFMVGGGIYRVLLLVVKMVLMMEEFIGEKKRGRGERMDGEGKCRFVGVVRVEIVDGLFMNMFFFFFVGVFC